MLLDDIQVYVDEDEITIVFEDQPTITFALNLLPEVSLALDLESFMSSPGSQPSTTPRIDAAFRFNKVVTAVKKTYGQTAMTITNNRFTTGIKNRTYAGVAAIPIVFGKAVVAKKTTFGQTALNITNNRVTAGSGTSPTASSYGDGAYGSGVYTGIIGYGVGLYGVSTYSLAPPQYGATDLPITFGKAVAGINPAKQTAVAEISLASHTAPANRVNHSIKVRARTTSGSTGKLRAALYEGATKRSGTADLETTALTNSLADYTLPIPDASAATITSYANLSIKIWGYDPSGAGLVFEVAKLYLELPSA